ncbi:hypothetical protein CRENBAI_019098 [Crenichthys baileyi]|uniref:Uncharacterized protein n=1 Tax=Crenichthys baileyi TaxID=28760 RepID=A0AAV9QYS9_9TELE
MLDISHALKVKQIRQTAAGGFEHGDDDEEEEEEEAAVQPPGLSAAQGGATRRSSSFIPTDRHRPPVLLQAAGWTPEPGPLPLGLSRPGSGENAHIEVRSRNLPQSESVQSAVERRPLRQKQRHCLDAHQTERLQAGVRAAQSPAASMLSPLLLTVLLLGSVQCACRGVDGLCAGSQQLVVSRRKWVSRLQPD